VLAFVSQFINPELGSVTVQMLVYGTWFAVLTSVGFALMGGSAPRISNWLQAKPNVINKLNLSAGLTFVASGVAIGLSKQS